ncbi:hypothetical protein [Lacticaseibacillus nasuensis]|uniref:hypothetical protein n=1 Tax=Lacticaseibacillus nasuensis TaxID=944671 RepID=UPI000AEACAA6|nr:hypothetical protein [Lacticaseibacillus nasuensis]
MTLHEIGYQAVQLDGMRGANPQVIAKLLKKYNLKVAGMHLHHERFFTDIDGLVQEALLFGSKILYDKYIDDDQQNDAGYRATRAQLYHVQDALRQLGFTIGLHSPESDYPDLVDGQRVLSYITQPQNGSVLSRNLIHTGLLQPGLIRWKRSSSFQTGRRCCT